MAEQSHLITVTDIVGAVASVVGLGLMKIYDSETSIVAQLYELAKRNSLNVDAAIDEIMSDDPAKTNKGGPITDEDIPF